MKSKILLTIGVVLVMTFSALTAFTHPAPKKSLAGQNQVVTTVASSQGDL